MKILFATTALGYSGAHKMMAWVANRMAERGHNVDVVSFYSDDDQTQVLYEDVIRRRLQVKRYKSYFLRNTIGIFLALWRLHRTVRKVKPDVVVTFLDSVGYIYLPLGRFFTKCKMVASERADPYFYPGNSAKKRVFLQKFAHSLVFQTHGAREYFKPFKTIYDNSAVIPNPVVGGDRVRALRQNPPSYEERDDRVVCVGRLSLRQKRQDVLIEAFKVVWETRPDLKLVIYGDGKDKARIQEIIDQSGLSNCATLGGRVDKVEETIFNARAFVLSSDFEGIPNSLSEALSVGVPSVSTDCSPGGAAVLIKDGENGFLVPRGDAKALAEKLAILVDDKETAERFTANGPLIADEFSEKAIADLWENFFLRLINDVKEN